LETSEQEHVFFFPLMVKADLPRLLPLVFFSPVRQRTKQVIICWCDFWAVGQYCSTKIRDVLSFCTRRVLFLCTSCLRGQQWTSTTIFK